ncbi:MAG: hypothetical protein NTX61_16895 [Bacteroidetes bacterium]|nr:hypothetical protein [Bacteroidota bacterium]
MDEKDEVKGGWLSDLFSVKNIILTLLAVLTALNTYRTQVTQNKLDIAQKQLDTTQSRLKIQSIALDNLLKKKEFESNLRFKIYDEVKEAVIKKDKQLQDVAVVIVNEMLSDDSSFRSNMNKILLGSPFTDTAVRTSILKTQIAESEFSKKSSLSGDSLGIDSTKLTIDVFYLQDILQESVTRAEKVYQELKKKYPDAVIRKRLLPRSINAQSGYRVGSNQIRFKDSQQSLAMEIQILITDKKIFKLEQLQLHPVRSRRSPSNYISIFVRNM